MRSYIVIPEGTPVLHVLASTPHFAASKARRGKGTALASDVLVLPVSRVTEADDGLPDVIPGQLSLEEAKDESQR